MFGITSGDNRRCLLEVNNVDENSVEAERSSHFVGTYKISGNFPRAFS